MTPAPKLQWTWAGGENHESSFNGFIVRINRSGHTLRASIFKDARLVITKTTHEGIRDAKRIAACLLVSAGACR